MDHRERELERRAASGDWRDLLAHQDAMCRRGGDGHKMAYVPDDELGQGQLSWRCYACDYRKPEPPSAYLTVDEIGVLLGLDRLGVLALADAGVLELEADGVPRAQLEAFMAAGRG